MTNIVSPQMEKDAPLFSRRVQTDAEWGTG
jgi:hypothetical protein